MTWIIIAFRNLIKNGRRSFFTIAAITLGYAAVVLFDGFINYMFISLEESVIFARGSGHMTVFKTGFQENGKIHPDRYLISKDELTALKNLATDQPEILLVSPELHISGLISNGQVSTIFMAAGRIPSVHSQIKSHASGNMFKRKFYKGQPLQDDFRYGIGIGASLSKLMGFPLGTEDAVVVAPTIDGGMNALDTTIVQTFHAGNEALEDKLMMVSLSFAQELYDTDSVDRVRLLLNKEANLVAVIDRLEIAFAEAGLDLSIVQWTYLESFYVKVKKLFEFIFLFVFLIVITVVVMSIVNTLSMAIMERTREIGTMRALGLKRWGVIRLFSIESSVLVFIGSMLGLAISFTVRGLIDFFELEWMPPMLAVPIPLEIHLNYSHMLAVFVILEILAIIAAILPARRAAYSNIVDALGHV